jgi:2-C-methyl-D-erythritol 4-phosphate cytidylyltransferase
MSTGSNIRRRRIELGMSQQELATVLGYRTRSTIAKIESGDNDVSLSKLKKFASVLGTTVENLIGSTEQETVSSMMMNQEKSHNTAIILAGGNTDRNNQKLPTQFATVLGKPLIIYSLETYQNHPSIDEIIIVCLKGWEDILRSYVTRYKISKVSAIIKSGDSAILSARNAFEHIMQKGDKEDEDILIFQEATRPLVPETLISKLLYYAHENSNAITYESMQEYIQFNVKGNKCEYLDRDNIIAAQGPEAYTFKSLKDIFAKSDRASHVYSESCCYMLFYNMGEKLHFCEGSSNNIKVVRQEDIVLLESLLR